MAEYVCTQLSNPNLITGQRTCQAWFEYQPTTQPALLPDLTMSEWSNIAIAMVTVLAVAWCFKTISTFVKES